MEWLVSDWFGGNRPVLGAWTVAGEPAGLVTGLDARFIPHLIRDRRATAG